jgi:hypothetical protein
MLFARRAALVSLVALTGCAHADSEPQPPPKSKVRLPPPVPTGPCDEATIRELSSRDDYWKAYRLSGNHACPSSLRAEVEAARARSCDELAGALVDGGQRREADLARIRRPECIPELNRHATAGFHRQLDACAEEVDRLLSEGKVAEARRLVTKRGRTCTSEAVEKVTRAERVRRCEAAAAKLDAPGDVDLAALDELRRVGDACPDAREKAESRFRQEMAAKEARFRERVAKDPCLLATSLDAAERSACYQHLIAALRAHRWADAVAELNRVPGTKALVLPDVVAALRSMPPRAAVPGLPSLRSAELALDAVELGGESPWAATVAALLAKRAGYPWELPQPLPAYLHLASIRSLSVEQALRLPNEWGTEVPVAAPIPVQPKLETVDEMIHTGAASYDKYTNFSVGGVDYTIKSKDRVADQVVPTGKKITWLTALTFQGGSGLPAVTIPLAQAERRLVKGPTDAPGPSRRQADAIREVAQKAWPSVRARWLDGQARAARQAMSAATTDDARLEAAVRLLAAGVEDAAARALVERRFGPLPALP